MTICLMPHIPYDAVFGRVVNIMKGNGNLNHPKTRSQMSWINGEFLYDVLSQLLTYLRQFVHLQFAQVFRILYFA